MNPERKGVAVMAYTITDIAELVRYHLVLSQPDDERADANLAQLVQQLRWRAARCGGKRRGSSAIGAGARSIPNSSTLTATTTPTMATSTAWTVGPSVRNSKSGASFRPMRLSSWLVRETPPIVAAWQVRSLGTRCVKNAVELLECRYFGTCDREARSVADMYISE